MNPAHNPCHEDEMHEIPTREELARQWRDTLGKMHPGNRLRLMAGLPLLPEAPNPAANLQSETP